MKKQPNNYQKRILLDKYEKTIEASLAKGNYSSVENFGDSKKFFEEAAGIYKELQKTRPITLRVNQEDLILVKARSKKSQIPYQRLVSALIHQYAEGATDLVV